MSLAHKASRHSLPKGRIFLAGASQRIRRAVAADPFARRVARDVLDESARLRQAGPLTLRREGGRKTILPTCRELSRRIFVFGVAQVLDGKTAHARCAARDLDVAAALADWNPDHFLDTAEMAAAAALGYSWFKPFLSAPQRRRLLDAIVAKGLDPGLAALRGGAFWTTCGHNWNIVCCGGLIIAAAALGEDGGNRCREILRLAPPAMAHGLSSYGRDGHWPEGTAYWEYATRYAVLATAALAGIGADEGQVAGLAGTWRYILHMTGPTGLCFDYGDSLARTERSPVLGWLARRDASAAAASLQRRAEARDTHPLDLLFLGEEPDEAAAAAFEAVFSQGALAAFRSSAAREALFVAVKGGSNAVNHAHRDLGTFVLDAGGQRFVEDLGRDDYALPGYFDPALRPTFTRVGSAAHNLVLVDGRTQAGSAEAPMIASVTGDTLSAAVFEIGDPASPAHHRRGVALVGRRSVVVVDQLAARDSRSAGAEASWRMHTAAAVSRTRLGAHLRIGDAHLRMQVVEPAGIGITTSPVALRPGERPAEGIARLRIDPVGIGDGCRIAVVFSADEPERRAIELAGTPLERWCPAA